MSGPELRNGPVIKVKLITQNSFQYGVFCFSFFCFSFSFRLFYLLLIVCLFVFTESRFIKNIIL